MNPGQRLSLKLSIVGRVQGVGYRAWAVERARAHGLTGWVMNELDGTVTALLHGPAETVETMIAECRDGPPAAAVDRISIDAASEAPPPPFAVRRAG